MGLRSHEAPEAPEFFFLLRICKGFEVFGKDLVDLASSGNTNNSSNNSNRNSNRTPDLKVKISKCVLDV